MSSSDCRLSSVREEKRRLQLELQGLDAVQTGEYRSFIFCDLMWYSARRLPAAYEPPYPTTRALCCFIDAVNHRPIVSCLFFFFNPFALTDKQPAVEPFHIDSCRDVFRTNAGNTPNVRACIVADVSPHVLPRRYELSNGPDSC